jgi:hypothetical protein
MAFDTLPYIGYYPFAGGGDTRVYDVSAAFANFRWAVGAGGAGNTIYQSSVAATTDRLLGRFDDKWVEQGAGVELPASRQLSGTWTQAALQPAIGGFAASAALLYWGLRGYRLWPKGTLSPPQRTRSEWLAAGKRFEPYQYAVSLSIDTTQNLTAASTQITFDHDFLCRRIRVGNQGALAYKTAQALAGTWGMTRFKIGPNGNSVALSSDYAPWQMFEGSSLLTQWEFPIPITIPKDAIWDIQTIVDVVSGTDPNTPVTFEVIFDGEKMNG